MQHGRMRHLPHATLGLSVGDNGSVSKCETNAPAATVVHECVQDAHVACYRAKTLSVSLSRCLVSRMWSALSGGTCGFPVNQTAACRMRLAVRSCLLPLPAAVAGIKTKLFPPTRKKGRQLAQFDFGPTHTHTHTHSGRGCVSCCVLRLLAAPPAAFVGLDAARRSDPLRRDLCPCSPLAHPLAVQQSQSVSLSVSLSLSGLSIAAIAVGAGLIQHFGSAIFISAC